MTRLFAVALLLSLPLNAQEFKSSAIAGHMKFLASDLLEGRGAGTRGYDIAASYVASQFEAAGVEPGAGSSYFQPIRFHATTADPSTSMTIEPDRGAPMRLKFKDAFVTSGDPLQTDRTVTGRLLVAGYGITAPELNHDDYAGVDAIGKIVVVFSGAPSRFNNTVRAHYSSGTNKVETAAARGAIGMLVLERPDADSPTPWSQVIRNYRGTMHWLNASGAPHDVNLQLPTTVRLDSDFAGSLFEAGGRKLADVQASLRSGTFRSFELPMRATIRFVSSHERVESSNVVGLVRGSDPTLRDQYLVYSSHLDHIGITAPVDGDSINNGAFDNASGIAALIEVARAAALANPRPKRSMIFLATTAEERGLRGADYFAHNPTVPRDGVVANINLDQIMMIDAVRDVIVHGIEHSNLGDAARLVASRTGITISPDPFPEEVVFVRSDQYPFMKRGIPALYIDSGYAGVDPSIDAKANQAAWLKQRYHRPNDDLLQKMDFSVPAMVARYAWLVGQEIASRDVRPAWNRGDFFGEKFGRR